MLNAHIVTAVTVICMDALHTDSPASCGVYDHITESFRPKWRGRVHAAAAPLFAGAGGVLAFLASGVAIIASLVFATSMLVCFGVSASYHIVAKTKSSQQLMQRLDHAAINILIAGTATPIYVLGVPTWWSPYLLAVTWAGALLGVVLKVTQRGWRLASGLYLLTGWIALAALPALWVFAGATVAILILGGGVFYTVGAVLFWLRKLNIKPEVFGYHESWHVATVLGAGTHFTAVALLILH